jgi:hypothetical protein
MFGHQRSRKHGGPDGLEAMKEELPDTLSNLVVMGSYLWPNDSRDRRNCGHATLTMGHAGGGKDVLGGASSSIYCWYPRWWQSAFHETRGKYLLRTSCPDADDATIYSHVFSFGVPVLLSQTSCTNFMCCCSRCTLSFYHPSMRLATDRQSTTTPSFDKVSLRLLISY